MNKKRYLREIVIIPIFFTILISIVIIYMTTTGFQKIFQNHILTHKENNIKLQKRSAKNKIKNIIRYANHIKLLFPNNPDKQKSLVIQYIKEEQKTTDYIFILTDVDLKGGDKFAKMYINPNRKDLVGVYLSDSYKDVSGKEFRKEMLKDIRNDGDAFVEYIYKKPNSNKQINKISYFRYYKEFNWIVATGVYMDDINLEVELSVKEFKTQLLYENKKIIIISLILIALLTIILCIIMLKFRKYIQLKEDTISKNNNILKTIIKIQHKLLSNNNFNENVNYVLAKTLRIVDTSRVFIFKNDIINNDLYCTKEFEYIKNNITSNLPSNQKLFYKTSLQNWQDKLENGEIIKGNIEDFPKKEQNILDFKGVKSILIVPIIYENRWWGFIGFGECASNKIWTHIEEETLDIIANSFISALQTHNYNKRLEDQVSTQIAEIRKKDTMLIQQSKMASMGEMIGNIAHQWRQPLNVIGASLINLQFKYETNSLDEKVLDKFIDTVDTTIHNMSQTIDDFRNFFTPNKEKEDFNIEESIGETLELLGSSFKVHGVNIKIDFTKSFIINGYKNEFNQVILVLLNNSKDAIVQNKIKDGSIIIDIYEENNNIVLDICDNAGGIEENILGKVFEPYFTTKFKSNGTGIGLYMAKEIIEKHMNGSIDISNFNSGVKIQIKLEKKDDNR